MKERKHLMDYLAEMMLIFGITLLIITVICCLLGEEAKEYSTMFALGSKGVPANTILQFLISSACITGLRFLSFSDRMFKKMSIAKRTIIMLLSVIVLIGVFAYIFDWFPVTNLKCWLSFLVCFGICFIVSVVISYLKENMDNKQLADGLNRIKGEQNGVTDRGK